MLTVCSWSAHDQLMVCSRSANDQVVVCSRSVHGLLAISSRSVHGQLTVCSRSAHGQLIVCSRSVHGQLFVCSRSTLGQRTVRENVNNVHGTLKWEWVFERIFASKNNSLTVKSVLFGVNGLILRFLTWGTTVRFRDCETCQILLNFGLTDWLTNRLTD
jgi:hypothetical protein